MCYVLSNRAIESGTGDFNHVLVAKMPVHNFCKLPASFLYQLSLLNNCTMARKCIQVAIMQFDWPPKQNIIGIKNCCLHKSN